jgi:hypothetical protein
MESDSVRTMGDSTLVDLWIEGKFRAITISRQAIESYLRLPAHRVEVLSEDDRREFVRTHLSLIVNAATVRLHANPGAEAILIDHFGGERAPAVGERRAGGDRRKGDRRKRNLGPPGGVERRGR